MKTIPLKQFKRPDIDDQQLARCAEYLKSVGYEESETEPGTWVYGGGHVLDEAPVTGVMNLQNGMRAVAKCSADLVVVLAQGGESLGLRIK